MSIEPGSGTLRTKHGIKVHARTHAGGPIYMTPCGITGHVEEDGIELMDTEFDEIDEENRCNSCEEQVFDSKNIRYTPTV